VNIPNAVARKTRYPVVLLVDVSASTGFGSHGMNSPDADIHRINAALQSLFAALRTPPEGSKLERVHKSVDLAIISYSDAPTVQLQWTPLYDLPECPPVLTWHQSTRTWQAMMYALDYADGHINALKRRNISVGKPNILHFTDGCPTDMEPGSPEWTALQTRLRSYVSKRDGATRKLALTSFVAKNGCDPQSPSGTRTLSTGETITGLEFMTRLGEGAAVHDLGKCADTIPDLIELVTMTMSEIPSDAGGGNLGLPGIKEH
jgi:uncharacterized protein YegL